jgi:hypothetical protein
MRASDPTGELHEEKRVFGFWRLFAWAVLALVTYVLSVGPVSMIYLRHEAWWDKHPAANQVLQVFYWPVFWAEENTFLHKPISAYLDWWEQRAK